MKQTQNQFYGKIKDITRIPSGSTFLDTDTGKTYYSGGISHEQVNSDINKTHVENDFSIGFNSINTKKNTDGTGWKSSVYSANFNSIADSTELINNLVGSKSLAEHIGSGQSYFIVGAENRAYHTGSGNTGGMYGANIATRVQGDGAGDHGYVIGANVESKLDNPNATVDYLQGMHLSVKVSDGEVTGNVMALILDLDNAGGAISGDFEYLRIQNDTFTSVVGGTSRAINSLSVLPSEFGGSIQAAGLINSAVTEHADNAAAVVAGLAIGTQYRTGDLLKIVH